MNSEPSTLGTLPRVLVGTMPIDALFEAATDTVYVSNQGSDTLSVVNARTCNARDTAGCGRTPPTAVAGTGAFSIAIDKATHTLYVTDNDSVSVINAATCNAEDTSGCSRNPATLNAGVGPGLVVVDPLTDTVYVADQGPGEDGSGDTVSVINGATCNASNTSGCSQTPSTIKVGTPPNAMALDTANETLYVADGSENAVSMIDMVTCAAGHTSGCAKSSSTAAVGEFPASIAIDSKTDTVYVGNNKQPTVSVMNGATCNATDTTGCLQHPVTLDVNGGSNGGMAIDEATETLFVGNDGPGTSTARTNSVSVINAATCDATKTSGCDQRARTVLTGANPVGIAVDEATDTFYVTSTFDNSLVVVNGATCNAGVTTGCGQATPATLAGHIPYAVAVNPATHTVYVSDLGGYEGTPWAITVLNAATCNTLDSKGCTPHPPRIPMQSGSGGLAVDQATDTLYAANGDGTVKVIDGRTCNASVTSGCGRSQTVDVGSPSDVAVNQATDTIYVADGSEGKVSVIDGKTCNSSHTSGCGQNPHTVLLQGHVDVVAVDQATDTVYALGSGTPSSVSVINGATCNASVTSGCGQVPHTVIVGDNPGLTGLAVDQATDTVYAVNTVVDTVSVINGATCNAKTSSGCGQTPAQVKVGRQNVGFVAVDQGADLVYVVNNLDDTVSIINGATCNGAHTEGCHKTPPTVPAGGNPTGIAVDQKTHTVYVADNADGPVSFFRFEVPGAPTRVTASMNHGEVDVRWQPPRDGGLPVVYRVITSPACPACTGLTTPSTSGEPDTIIGGLDSGLTYTFKVQATNAAGIGPISAASTRLLA